MCLCEVSVCLNIRVTVRLNGTLIMVPEENGMMEKCHFLATQEITLWKLCHQSELIDALKNSVPSKQTHILSILSKINVKRTFAQFVEKGLCVQGRGWVKREL